MRAYHSHLALISEYKMRYIEIFYNRIIKIGVILSSICLSCVMILVLANVITRLFNIPIQGTYELSELLMMSAGGFCLAYATIHLTNIEITLVAGRLPKLAQNILHILAAAAALMIWIIILSVGINLVFERGLREQTDALHLIYLPFRCFWIIGLVLLCIASINNTYQAVRRINK